MRHLRAGRSYRVALEPPVVAQRFEKPDEVRRFPKGRFEIVKLGGSTIGRATYEPGWKWSLHVGAESGAKLGGVSARS